MFLTTPISKEEGGNNNICQIPLEELYTKNTVLEVSQALQEENKASQAPQEADKISQALQLGGNSQLGGVSSNYNIVLQPNRPPLINEKQAGLNQQDLFNLGGHFYQEGNPLGDIYQEDLKQILTKYLEEEAKPIANTHTQSKLQFNYSILHKTERKELAVKATYFTLAFAYIFVNALLQPQQIKIIKGLPPKLYNQKEAINLVFKKKWKAVVDKE